MELVRENCCAHCVIIKVLSAMVPGPPSTMFFFFNDPATTEIYTLSLHDALPICSSFKPFVLATALDQGVSLDTYFNGPPAYTVPDVKCGTNGVLWDVHNFADESAGTMNLVDATAHSVNTIFAQLVDKVGPTHVVRTAHMMGIRSRLQSVCSITLGTQAVNPLEMTDAYATLAARGVHRDPQAFELVRGPRGGVIGKLHAPGAQMIPRNVADTVTYALQGVVQHGT